VIRNKVREMKYSENIMTAEISLKFIDVVRWRLRAQHGFDTHLVVAVNYEYNNRKIKMNSIPPD